VSFAYSYVIGLLLARDPRTLEALDEMRRRFPRNLFTDLSAFGTFAALGRHDEARALLTPELEQTAWNDLQYSMSLAEALAQLGETDRAFAYLDNAIDRGFCVADYIERTNWMLEPLRDARFAARVQRAREKSAALRTRVP
jgi:predicted Zn-dependent protease